MAVSIDEVRHIARLARLDIDDARAAGLVAELNTILAHMDVLSAVDTGGAAEVAGIGAFGAPLRPDVGPPVPLARPIASFAPREQDGFFLVPRLSAHDDPESA